MKLRSVDDRLREEYFSLLPDIRRVAEQLETEIRHCLLPVALRLEHFERILVKSRVKECDSALEALRRRQEGSTFDKDRAESYTLTTLKDLAGVRVLVFPGRRIDEVKRALLARYGDWKPDPVPGLEKNDEPLALKYYGHCSTSSVVGGEFQILPMLIGLFWDVEHAAIYKPAPRLKGMVRSLEMRERTADVVSALRKFEFEFDQLLARASSARLSKK